MRKILPFIFFILFGLNGISQVNSEAWRRTEIEFTGISSFETYFLSNLLPDSCLVVAGVFNDQVKISKFDRYGNLIWTDSISGSGDDDDSPIAISVSPSGFIYITGYLSNANSEDDIFTACYSLQGIRLWLSVYEGAADLNDQSYDIITDNSGNAYVAGFVTDVVGGQDAIILAYNPFGNLLWINQKNGSANLDDRYSAICTDNLGYIYTVGLINDSITNQNAILTKINFSGQVIFDSIYDFISGNDYYTDIIYRTGHLYIEGKRGNGAMLIDRSSSGALFWLNSINIIGDMILDPLGRIVIAGLSNNDIRVVVYNSNGILVWGTTYIPSSFNGNDNQVGLECDDVGNIYVSGQQQMIQSGNFDQLLLKFSPTGIIEWNRRITGNYTSFGPEYFAGIVVFDDRVITVGVTYNVNSIRDATISSFDFSGNQLFHNVFSTYQYSNANEVLLGEYISGNILVAATFYPDVLLLKSYTAGGIAIWSDTFHLPGIELRALEFDNVENIIVGGVVTDTSSDYDIWVGKFSPTGTLIWQDQFSSFGNYNDQFGAIAIGSNNEIYLGGSYYNAPNNFDAMINKIDSSGNVIWTRFFNGSANNMDGVTDVKLAPDSALYVLSNLTNTTSGGDIHLAKMTILGDTIWTRTISGLGNYSDIASSLNVYPDSGVALCGLIFAPVTYRDIYASKYDRDGSLLWSTSYTGSVVGSEEINDVKLFGDTLVIGGATPHNTLTNDILTIAIDNSGSLIWSDIYNGLGNSYDVLFSIAKLSSTGNIVVGGYTQNSLQKDMICLLYNTTGLCYDTIIIHDIKNETISQVLAATNNGFYVSGNVNEKSILTIKFCDGPVVSCPTSANLCIGDTAVLNVSGGFIYNWYPQLFLSSYNVQQPVFNGTQSITYTIQAVNAIGCFSSATQQVIVHPNPDIQATDSLYSICSGDTIELNTYGAVFCNWTPTTNLSSAFISDPFAYPDTNTTYIVSGTDLYGCLSDTATIRLTVNPRPGVSLALNLTDTICMSASPILLSGGVPSGGFFSGSGISSGVFYPQNTMNGIVNIFYSFTDSNGCAASSFDSVFVDSCIITSLNQIYEPQIYIFPSLVSESFKIQFNSQGQFNVKVFSIYGEMVFEKENIFGGDKFVVETLDWKSGLYLVCVIGDLGELLKCERITVIH